jgi:hypothetical protein
LMTRAIFSTRSLSATHSASVGMVVLLLCGYTVTQHAT